MFGLRFDEDEDAETFRRRITSRIQLAGAFSARSLASRASADDVRAFFSSCALPAFTSDHTAPCSSKQQQQRQHAPTQPVAVPPHPSPPSSVPRPLPDPFAPAVVPAIPSSPSGSPRAAQSTPLAPLRKQQQPPPRSVSPRMISAPAPGSFVHVAHVGLDATTGRLEASAQGTCASDEPGWTMILEELHGFGVAAEEIKMVERRNSFDFLEGFLAGAKASLIQELRKTSALVPCASAAKGPKRSHAGGFQFVQRPSWDPSLTDGRSCADAGFVPHPVRRTRVPGYY